jgi:hypothetical protein
MNKGLLERILTRRYGQPVTSLEGGLVQQGWNANEPDNSCTLYVGMKWNTLSGLRFGSLKGIYGNAFGGFLARDVLTVAVVGPREVPGLLPLDEFRMLAPVQYASTLDPAIDFFMDAAGIWYYGIKKGELWVFDTERDELDCLGKIEPALETLLDDWEEAGEDL